MVKTRVWEARFGKVTWRCELIAKFCIFINMVGPTVAIPRVASDFPELVFYRELLSVAAELDYDFQPKRFSGKGIVICGGGERYLPSTYVLVNLLRHLRCTLPIEVWHLGANEMPEPIQVAFSSQGVVCVDACQVRRIWPVRRLSGWELKCYAILHSAFEEVLLLDADNSPVRDPSDLFVSDAYLKTGAIFWPDFGRFAREQAVWRATGIKYRDEPEFESGQIVVDKRRCWRALNVAMHLNEYSDWWYQLIHGDKDTFHLAWRKVKQAYSMPKHPVASIDSTMLQFDFNGKLLFQHRNFAKWKLQNNKRIDGFVREDICLKFIDDLNLLWMKPMPQQVTRWKAENRSPKLLHTASELCAAQWTYHRLGLDKRTIRFLPDGRIGEGGAHCERWWDLALVKTSSSEIAQLTVAGEDGLTFSATKDAHESWRGRWLGFENAVVVIKKRRETRCSKSHNKNSCVI